MIYIQNGRDRFYQWDVNQYLVVENEVVSELHFTNAITTEALITKVYEQDGKKVAAVPNILLQTDWDILVYGGCGECVREMARFKVEARAKPSDYIYTETELITIESEVREILEEVLPKAVKAEVKEILPAEVEKVLPIGEVANAVKGENSFTDIFAPTDISPLPHTINFKGNSYKYFNVYENIIPNTRTIGAIKESKGVTFTEMGNNIIIANGTNDKSGTSNYILYDDSVSLPAGNYTVYGCGKGDKTYSSDSPYKAILYVWDSNGDRFDYTCNRANNSYSFKVNNPIERIQLKLQVAQGVAVINQEFYSILVNEDTKKRYRFASNGKYPVKAFTNIVVSSEDKSTITMYYNKDINKVLESIIASIGGEK